MNRLTLTKIAIARAGVRLAEFARLLRSRHVLTSAVTILLSLLTVTTMTGVLYFRNDVVITADGTRNKYFTMKEDAREILAEFGYSAGEYDRVESGWHSGNSKYITIARGTPVEFLIDGERHTLGVVPGESYADALAYNGFAAGQFDGFITNDGVVRLARGFGVNITADGRTVTVGTLCDANRETVNDVLRNAAIEIGEGDVINLPFDSYLNEGDEIIISRVSYRERTHTEPIPFETAVEYSNLLAIGETRVSEGIPGESVFVLREKLINGEVVSSEVIETYTIEPVTEIVTHGQALRTPYSQRDFPEIRLENGRPVEYVRMISGKASAYTAGPTSGTASGRRLEIGTVAVDPNIIPYGSLLYIVTSDGSIVYGAAVAADTGGFTHNGSGVLVDVYMGLTSENLSRARQWGIKWVDVYIISTGVY